MVKILMTVVITAAVCFGAAAGVGFGGTRHHTEDVYPGSDIEFRGANLSCSFLHAHGGNVVVCGTPDTLNGVSVNFTSSWIRVWSIKKVTGQNCCKTLVLQHRRY